MSNYQRFYTAIFKQNLKALKRHRELLLRLEKKVEEILVDPSHYKNLRNILKNQQRVHIGSFVLIFEVDENKKMVYFLSFQHHDEAYK